MDKLQEEMRRITNIIATDKEILAGIQNKCENLMLVYDIGQRQIDAAKKLTQQKQVEENMMRLRVYQIEKEKEREENNIFSLENLRLNLDQVRKIVGVEYLSTHFIIFIPTTVLLQAMKERQVEITTQKTIILAKRRNLEDDRGRLKADMALRRLKIEQIKKKYHLAFTALRQNVDGEHVSISQLKIKNAQEKYILQQEGDELDQKIKTTEQEIVAMENTLKLVNLSNHSFKNSLSPVKDNGKLYYVILI